MEAFQKQNTYNLILLLRSKLPEVQKTGAVGLLQLELCGLWDIARKEGRKGCQRFCFRLLVPEHILHLVWFLLHSS